MIYDLPTSVEVGGAEYEIRSDYRAVLEICTALTDVELSGQEKAFVLLSIFYPGLDDMPPEDYKEAVEKCYWFIDCGDEQTPTRKAPKLMDWEQDFKYIVAPINRVLGCEVRSIPYDYENNTGGLHWWTFVAAYYEIGDCLFAQIARIRNLRAKGKPLDKADRAWYAENRHLVDLHTAYTEQENELLKQWGGGG